jgi:DNA-binding MarR family transcriptional regulator
MEKQAQDSRQKLLESLFQEAEHLGPGYRKKITKPLMSCGTYHFSTLQRMTIMFLFRSGSAPMSAIAAFHGISKQQMTPIVEGLEKQGLVQRNINPDNRREVLVSITKRGDDLFKKMKEQAIQEWMGKLDTFSNEEIQEILGHLRAINGFLKRVDE